MVDFHSKTHLLRTILKDGFGPWGSSLAFNLFAVSRRAATHWAAIRGRRDAYRVEPAIPRIVWMYWAQGIDAAPPVVRRCVESWSSANPDWRVEVLDDKAAQSLVELSDLSPNLTFTTRSDMIRLRLLSRYGGVWADATCLCRRPLGAWLDLSARSGFFAFARPEADRLLSSWFLAATPQNPLVVAWERRMTRYFSKRTEPSPFYLAIHYVFHWVVLTRRDARAVWRAASGLPATPSHLAQRVLRSQLAESDAVLAAIDAAPISKLTHKYGLESAAIDPLFARARARAAALRLAAMRDRASTTTVIAEPRLCGADLPGRLGDSDDGNPGQRRLLHSGHTIL